jgi:hypothetical protein
MPPKKISPARTRTSAARQEDTTAFLAALEHPLKPEIRAVRSALLAADASIRDAVKWNSVSFRTTEFFATVFLRSTDRVQIVFHFGAKARKPPKLEITAPSELVRWVAPDRCLLTLGAGPELTRNLPALQDFVRAWIRYV